MALFKAFSGKRSYLDSEPKVEGHAYFCTDDGTFHIDYKDIDGVLQRKPVNDKYINQLLDLQEIVDGMVVDIPLYTVTCEDTDFAATDSTAAYKRHTLKQLGNTICTIDVPVDLVVKSGSVKEVTAADDPYTGAAIGDKYIELVIANQDTPIYVPAKDLVDIYTTETDAKVIQLSIDGNNVISANIVDKSITEAKLSDDITTKLAQIAINTENIADRYTKTETDTAIINTINNWWASLPDGEELDV